VIYLLALFVPYWLGRFIFLTLFPLLQISTNATSILQFTYSNLPWLCFIPAFLASLLTFRVRDWSTVFVWVFPVAMLVYSLVTFETRNSVLEPDPRFSKTSLSRAFAYYFDRHFSIPHYSSGREFWDIAATNPDVLRGARQLSVVGPFYVALGYSLAAWLCLRTGIDRKILAAMTGFFDRIGPTPQTGPPCDENSGLSEPEPPQSGQGGG
jgi:hypothetical protein